MSRHIEKPIWLNTQRTGILALLFLVALVPRLYSAQTVGWDWFGQGTFTAINFDEANTCRAWLDAANYSPLVGAQTVTISTLLGNPPPAGASGNYGQAKAYCLGSKHMRVARSFSAVLGALTVVAISMIALLLSPANPNIAWSAGLLLAFSGFHATQSHMATVDATMTFYLYLFILAMVIAVSRRALLPMLLSFALLVPAVFSKHFWPMPFFAYLAFVPQKSWRWFMGRTEARHVIVVTCAALIMAAFAFNTGFKATGWYPMLALFYLFVPWRKLNHWTIPLFLALPWLTNWLAGLNLYYILEYTSGRMSSNFGSWFGSIGWNKFARNFLNFPVVLIVGIGLPAALLIPRGIRQVVTDEKNIRLWLCFLPVLVFAAYMLLIVPRTTYRHYLPLIPAAALLAAYGLWSLRIARNRLFLTLFFTWPLLLLIDFEQDFHQDTRRQAIAWYEQHPNARIFTTFYANPPPNLKSRPILFKEEYALGDDKKVLLGQFLVLSENWYDTAFANELNGPLIENPEHLIKTRPQYVYLYRDILSDSHPNLELVSEFNVQNFMPELVLHKMFYGTFQKFVGDLKIYKITR